MGEGQNEAHRQANTPRWWKRAIESVHATYPSLSLTRGVLTYRRPQRHAGALRYGTARHHQRAVLVLGEDARGDPEPTRGHPAPTSYLGLGVDKIRAMAAAGTAMSGSGRNPCITSDPHTRDSLVLRPTSSSRPILSTSTATSISEQRASIGDVAAYTARRQPTWSVPP
jgi:hypothetical protein